MVVFKVGGSLNGLHKEGLLAAIAEVRDRGEQVIIVHGGGPAISKRLQQQGMQLVFREGQRLTPPAAMSVVEDVLNRQVNAEIVGELVAGGLAAEGISGRNGIVFGVPLFDGVCTGRVDRVNPMNILTILQRGRIPVISPIGAGPDDTALNINADAVAGAIAAALKVDRLVFLTDVDGIYRDWQQQVLITHTTYVQLNALLAQGVFSEGMIPKTDAVLFGLKSGVRKVYVVHGGKPDHVLWSVQNQPATPHVTRNFGTLVIWEEEC